MINKYALKSDQEFRSNVRMARRYKGYVRMRLLREGPLSLAHLYKGNVLDIPLYLAVHELIEEGKVMGVSPYDVNSPKMHDQHWIEAAEEEPLPF